MGDVGTMVQPDARKKNRALLDSSLMYKEIQRHSTTDNDVDDTNDDAPIENAVEMIALDSLLHQLSQLGFLHIVVKGWDYKVIQESWKEKDCKWWGIVDADPEELIDG
eukprot:10966556-Ditylum_brightwellii.AAC.1